MKFLRTLLVAVAVVATALTLPLTGSAHAASPSHEDGFLAKINEERSVAGLGALAVHSGLVPVARNWTDKMVGDLNISHNPNLAAQAPGGWQRLGENVGMGGDVDGLHRAFMNSTGHRANVLGDFNLVGIGVSFAPNGTMFVTVDFMKATATSPVVNAAATSCGTNVNPAPRPSGTAAGGYYVLGNDGGIFSFGNAPFRGSVPGLGVSAQAVLMAVTPSKGGYWVLGNDGGIFSFGDAAFHGSVPGLGLSGVRAIDLKPTPSGRGYWILGADGGIFSFGDAAFHGSLPGVGVVNQGVRLLPTPSGRGYWILGADGGIFSFGDAVFHGSLPGVGARNTSISMAVTPSGRGYWILGADGGIFSFGDAAFFGSVPGFGQCSPVRGTQIVGTRSGSGYYVLSDRGGVFAFGDAPHYGSPAPLGVGTRDMAIV